MAIIPKNRRSLLLFGLIHFNALVRAWVGLPLALACKYQAKMAFRARHMDICFVNLKNGMIPSNFT